MRIIPKIGECEALNNKYITDKILQAKACEVQLLSYDLSDAFNNTSKLLDRLRGMDYVIIHTPFSALWLDAVYSNRHKRTEYLKLIHHLSKYADRNSINIDFITHVTPCRQQFICSGAIEFIQEILSVMSDWPIGLLIENSIISLNSDDNEESTESFILDAIKDDRINFCLDLCHLQSSENAIGEDIRLSSIEIDKLKNIHFSATLNKDGFRDKKLTHGRRHVDTAHIMQDLSYLDSKGINYADKNIVLEINEEDYIYRPDLEAELKLIYNIKYNIK